MVCEHEWKWSIGRKLVYKHDKTLYAKWSFCLNVTIFTCVLFHYIKPQAYIAKYNAMVTLFLHAI